MVKKGLVTVIIILAVIIFAVLIMDTPVPETPEEVAKCIGENSVLYVQLGCSHCKTQEDMFGDNYKYLNVIDCFYERDKCSEISGTPAWIIDDEEHSGVQSIEKLKELTGCQVE